MQILNKPSVVIRDDEYWIKRRAKENFKREKKEALAQLKIELYNLAKPLRFSNCHAASVKLIKNEIIVLKQLGQRENEILRWQWVLSSCKELIEEIKTIEAS